MKTDIWMAYYPSDYLRDTMHLSTEQHGAYWLLITAYWVTGGPLPDDDKYLANVTRLMADAWQTHRQTLCLYFTVANGKWTHTRIDKELAIALNNRSAKQKAGEIGAKARWNGKTIATALADASQTHWQTDAPSPSPSPNIERERVARASIGASEVSVPTLQEVLAFAEQQITSPIPEDVAKRFWEHYAGNNLWLNQHGLMINWKLKLRSWSVNDRGQAPQALGAAGGRPRISDLRSVIEIKKAQAETLANRYRSQTATDFVWSDHEKKAEFIKLRAEIKELEKRIVNSIT